jgi:site-specific DNA-methyltransferase (adenine-specific)
MDCRKIGNYVEAGTVDLIVADPPYNIGVEYDGWDDEMSDDNYGKFTRQWLETSHNLLSDHGSMFVYVPPQLGHHCAEIMEDFGMFHVNTICVVQRFGQHETNKFISGYRMLLYYTMSPDTRIWNMQDILVESDRRTKYNDKRTEAKEENQGMRVPLDVWGWDEPNFGRIQGNNAERRRLHPNQVPEKVLERVILAASAKGDLVFDPFTGSGTTPTVARALGRRYVGTEISLKFAKSAIQRVKEGPARVRQQQSAKSTDRKGSRPSRKGQTQTKSKSRGVRRDRRPSKGT